MSGQPGDIESAFIRLSKAEGFEGVLYLTSEGRVLGSRFREGGSPFPPPERTVDLLQEIRDLLRGAGFQDLEEIRLMNQTKSFLLLRHGRSGLMMAVLGQTSLPVGLVRAMLNEWLDGGEGASTGTKEKGEGAE